MAEPYVIVVKGSAWLNSNTRRHFHQTADLVNEWRANGKAAALTAKLPRFERVHIYAYVTFKDRRRHDAGNWYPTAKACVDGMVDAGMLEDDSDEHLIGPDMRPDHRTVSPIPTLTLEVFDLVAVTG